MKKIKNIMQYALIGSMLLSFMLLHTAQAAGLVEDGELLTAAFWQNITPDGDIVLLNAAEKKRFNKQLREKSSGLVDLQAYPVKQAASQIRSQAGDLTILQRKLYDANGAALTGEAKAALAEKVGLEQLSGTKKMQLGIVVRRSNLRNLPTAEPLFSEPEYSMFDELQESAVDPSEPCIILHTSRSGDYYYVQLYNYRGWLAAEDVALVGERKTWLQYVDPKEFLVVTDKSYNLAVADESVFYQMGSRLPLTKKAADKYGVRLPQRNTAGKLAEKIVWIEKSPALREGWLPYTRNNLLQAAFCYLDEPYGWGGLNNSVDCSSFVENVYRTVGIVLPRNADEQETTAGQHFPLARLDAAGAYQSLHRNAKAGDTLHMDGHVMLYLGEVAGVPYAIHALGSHTEYYDDGAKERQKVLKVVVSDLELQTRSGASFADALTAAVSFH